MFLCKYLYVCFKIVIDLLFIDLVFWLYGEYICIYLVFLWFNIILLLCVYLLMFLKLFCIYFWVLVIFLDVYIRYILLVYINILYFFMIFDILFICIIYFIGLYIDLVGIFKFIIVFFFDLLDMKVFIFLLVR